MSIEVWFAKKLPIILLVGGFGAILIGQLVMVKPDFSEIQWASMLLSGMALLNLGMIIWTINAHAQKQEQTK